MQDDYDDFLYPDYTNEDGTRMTGTEILKSQLEATVCFAILFALMFGLFCALQWLTPYISYAWNYIKPVISNWL